MNNSTIKNIELDNSTILIEWSVNDNITEERYHWKEFIERFVGEEIESINSLKWKLPLKRATDSRPKSATRITA